MDVVKAVETYVSKMISSPNAIKVLLLDSHTVRLITFIFIMSLIPHLDTYCIFGIDTEYAAFSASILDRQNQ